MSLLGIFSIQYISCSIFGRIYSVGPNIPIIDEPSMVVKFVKISSKSTTEAVREKSTRTFSKKYVIHHQDADFKIKNYSC